MIRLPRAGNPEVTQIVLLDGAAEMAERCLRAIATADESVPAETVVVLNDPGDELEDLVRKSTTGATVVLSRANAGPGVGWNLGAAVARAPRLATLHEDSEPQAGWLAPLCETMAETGAGAVGSRLFNRDDSIQNCGWVIFSDASHQPINADTAPSVAASSAPTPADLLSGAAMLVDRDAVRAAGGWDERFHPAVFVDIDISTAMWALGRPVLSVPASRVKHQGYAFDRRPASALSGRWLRPFLFERNRGPFIAKWGASMADLAPPPPNPEPNSVRAAVAAALLLTEERAERVRSEGPKAGDSVPKAMAPFTTTTTEPVAGEGNDLYAVSPEVTEALSRAETKLVDEYCRWLIEKEAEHSQHLLEQFEESQRQLVVQHEHIERLQDEHGKVTETLHAILNGRTWRLRTRLLSLTRRR